MRVLLGVLLTLVLIAAGLATILATGAWNVAATATPGKLEERLAKFALDRSVARRAPSSRNPLPASPEVWKIGLSHYRENCVACHGAPGVDAAEFGLGLNPPAPDLTLPRVQARTDGAMYWIVANGIRLTGMPAFAPTHEEREIWAIVSFVRHLEEITDPEQAALRAALGGADHHHGEGSPAETAPDASRTPGATQMPHAHPAGTPPHPH